MQNYYKRLDPPDAVILKLDLKEWKVGDVCGSVVCLCMVWLTCVCILVFKSRLAD